MQTRSRLKIHRLHPLTKRCVWLSLLVCLMALNLAMVAGDGGREAFPCACQQEPDGPRGCSHPGAHQTFLTAYAASPARPAQWLFYSPAETEPTDLEPVMIRIHKGSAVTTDNASILPKAPTHIVGIYIPLYLEHQSLLC